MICLSGFVFFFNRQSNGSCLACSCLFDFYDLLQFGNG